MSKVIMLRVGASAEASLGTVFDPLTVSARKAAAQVTRELNGTSAKAKAAAQQSVKEELRAIDEKLRAERRLSAEKARISAQREQEAVRAADRAAKEREKITRREFDERLRASTKARRDEEREILRTAARAEAAEKRALDRSNTQIARGRREMAGRVVDEIGSIARKGVGIASSILQGGGISMDIGSHMASAINLGKMATQLSNAGFQQGKYERIAPGVVKDAIKSAADSTGFGRDVAAQGLAAFVGLTGDLKTGMTLLPQFGRLALASGTELNDMAEAAANVSNALGDMPLEKKGPAVMNVLKAWAAMGKAGAVEIKDMASQGSKLAAAAMGIEGDPVENLKKVAGLVQMSRATGGAASAVQAATSLMSLENTFKTPARIAEFKAQGIDVFNKDRTALRDPQELIIEALEKTQGDPEKMKKMFANVLGAKPVEAATQVFHKSGAAGLREFFKNFNAQSMSEGEISDSFNARMRDDDVKAQLANNRLADSAEKLIPALEKLVPAFTTLADLVANNLGSTIAVAVGASIAKAALGDVLKNGIMNLFGGKGGAGVGAGAGGMGAAGAIGLTLGIAAIAITAGIANIDANVANLEKTRTEQQKLQLETGNTIQELRADARDGMPVDPEKLKTLDQQIASLRTRVTGGTEWNELGWWEKPLGIGIGGMSDKDTMRQAAGGDLENLKAELYRATSERAKLTGGFTPIEEDVGPAWFQKAAQLTNKGLQNGGEGGGASGLKSAADAHSVAAAALSGAAAGLVGAAGAIGAAAASRGGGGVDPSGRH